MSANLQVRFEDVDQAHFCATAYYRFLGALYVLHATHEATLEYADRFMKHYRTEPSDSSSTFIHIYATDEVDPAPYREAVEEQQAFTMHIGKGERWNMKAKALDMGEWRIVHLLNTGTVFLLNRAQQIGCVLGSLDRFLNEDAFHLIRSVMCRGAEALHHSIFHAAGTVIEGKGVMIVGESGRGKTTTFLEFLDKGAIPVSNDRVFVPSEGDELRMFEWPSFVNTSVGTIHKYPQMSAYKPDLEFNTLEELWYSKIKFPIEPHDFCRLFQVTYQPSHTIDIIVFPRLRPETEHSGIVPLTAAEAKALLYESCYSPNDPAYLDWHRYVPLDPVALQAQSDRIIDRLLSEVPCYAVEGGTSLVDAIEQVRNVLAGVTR